MNVKRFIHIWTIAILFLLFDVNIAAQEMFDFSADSLAVDSLVINVPDPEWYVAPQEPASSNAPMRASAASCKTDSVLIFNIDSVLTEVTTYAYDNAGHTISEVVWTVNADGSRIGKSKKEDLYEGNTQVMTSTYVWDNTTSDWKGSAKTEYEFTNGKNTTTTEFDWLNGTWSAKSQKTYVYDTAGRETVYTVYSRNAAGQLAYAQRREKTYNDAGKLVLDIQYGSYANGAWVRSTKYVYDYNASGTQTLYEYYSSYTNGAWVGSTRNVYEFDAAGNKILEEKYSGMTSGVWKGSSKYTATFNANKKETEHIAYKWNTTSKTWQNNTRTTKSYDGNNVTDDASYTWSSNKWSGKSRTSKTYSGTLVTSEIVWKWSNGWVHKTKTETQYSGSNISVQTKFAWTNSAWVNVSQLTNTYVSNRLTEANTKAWRNGAWQDSLRVTHGFNAKGIDTLAITCTWSGSLWISKDSTTRNVTYIKIGSKDYVTEDVTMKWVSTTNQWTGVSRETKEYDAWGNVIQSDTYTFVSGTGWVNNARHHYAYKDGNKNLETLNDYLTWNKNTNVWVGSSKTEKEYDATNRQIKISTYSWDASHNDWRGISSTEDVYENNIKVTSFSYQWDYTDWGWIGMFKHDYTYSGSKIKEQIDWRYNKTTGWYYDTKLTNTYDSKGRTIQTVNYQWIAADSQWCMTSTNQTTYDSDADGGRLREQLNATGSNCAVTAYVLKHYIYECDPIIIRFVNYDGTVLDTQILEKGVTPVYDGATPTREGGPDNSYTFIGWTPEIVPVTGNATYTAVFTTNTNTYTITWLNEDGSTIDQTTLGYGVMPTHDDPTKPSTAEFSYSFAGWTPGVGIVTGDATYQATYTTNKRSYTITWLNDDNTQIDQTSVEYGVVPTHDDPSKAATAEFTYTFAGWNVTPVAVTGPATYKATYSAVKNSYTITWLDDDNSSLGTTTVEYGIVPTHADPTKAATAEFTYTFAGWNPAVTSVTGDASYTATYTATKRSYTITWLNEDGSEIEHETLEYGATPVHADMTKENTAEYTYAFTGWTPAIVDVVGNASYQATFSATKNSYTITWLNEDGSEIEHETLEYGATPSHADVTKESTAEYTYAFAGWTPQIVTVTGDASYTASFTATKNKYTIIFLNYDGTELQSSEVEYGITPNYEGATPIKPADAQDTYTFAGWDQEIIPVAGTKTYTATFTGTKNSYTITWLNDDNTLIDQTTVEYGAMPQHEAATKENTAEWTYAFTGWSPAIVSVTGDATYQATYTSAKNSYTITWLNEDGSEIEHETLEYGATPQHADVTKENTAEYTYAFTGWTPAIVDVVGNASYQATFSATKNSYTITWLDDDNTQIDQTTVEYGVVPTHDDPTKAATAEFTYTFAGWDVTPVAVTGEATYKATYTYAKNSYTITWLDEDNSSLGTSTVEYGVVPTHDDPTKQPTAQYGYTFAGWSPAISAVTGNATYKATYTDTINQYTISWLDDTGTLVDQTKVAYGTTPAHANIYKEPDDQFDYTFVGWTPTIVPVTSDASYSAIFTTAGKSYTVTFYFEDGVTILDQMTLPYGAIPSTPYIPSIPSDANHTYTFSGWSPEIAPVTGDISYVPTFTAIPNQYTVIFRNYNGKELQRKKVDYGTIPEYEGDEPSRPATNSYTWAFEGWTPELVAVIGDATYTAVYTKVMNTYTILFYDEDGITLLDEVTVEHGQKPTTSVIPTKEADEEYRYTFAGWSPKIAKATSDAEYTATYLATPKTQDLNNTEAEERATKVLIDDHIYILRSGHTYTLDGMLVE